MTFDEATAAIVTRGEAVSEMVRHAWDPVTGDEVIYEVCDCGACDGIHTNHERYLAAVEADLVHYLGDHETYLGAAVLELIGY